MNKIEILHDPLGAFKRETITIEDGTPLLSWLIDKYGKDGFTVPTKVFVGGLSEEQEIDLKDYPDWGYILSNELVYIVHTPLGVEIVVAAVVFAVTLVIALSIPNIPVPEIPEYTNSASGESPNNSLSGQINIARPLQRIPDLYGKNRVYPDLIAKTYFEYINHVKYMTEYLCVGRGSFLLENLKSGDTLIENIDGSEATIYTPNTAPELLLDATDSNEVNGQEIKAPNDERLSLLGVTVSFETPNKIAGLTSDLYQFSNLLVGDQFTVNNADYVGSSVTGSSDIGFANAGGVNTGFYEKNNLTFEDDEISVNFENGLSFSPGDVIKVRGTLFNNGRYEVDTVSGEFDLLSCVEVGTSTPVQFINEPDTNGQIDSSGSDEITKPSGLGVFTVGETIFITGGAGSNNISVEVGTVSGTLISCLVPGTGTPIQFVPEFNTSAVLDSGFSNDGTFTFLNYLSSGAIAEVVVEEETFFNLSSLTVDLESTVASSGDTIGPFTVGGGEVSNIWVDFICQQGLRTDAGSVLTVDLTMRIQEIDEDGNSVGVFNDVSIEVTDSTTSARFYTFKEEVVFGRYEVTIIRTSNTEGLTGTRDTVKWTKLSGVNELVNPSFGDITTILIKTQATEQATSLQDRKFNAIATRKLFTYNLNTKKITTTLEPTAKFADAVLHILTDPAMGNKPSSQIDLDQLYTIQETLDFDPIYEDSLGRFCYSFSNSQTPVQTELLTILNSARVFGWREGNLFRFVRDKKQDLRTTLFSKRNKKPDSEKKSIVFRKPNDPDGIQLDWTSEDTGEGSSVFFPEDQSAINPKIIKAAGIKNYKQAWNRSKYEYLRMLYQRTIVEAIVTNDGLLVSLNDRVANIDGTNIQKQDGEVVSFTREGVITCSECIDFKGALEATVILRGEKGQLSEPIVVTPRVDGISGFKLKVFPDFPIVIRGDLGIQIGTLYHFEVENNQDINDFVVQEIIPNPDGYVNLKLLNYSEEIYIGDTEIPT